MKVTVLTKPNSKKGPLVELQVDGSLTVYLSERAIDGAANSALIELLAKHYGVPKTTIQIIRGTSSRHKVIEL